MELAHLGPLTTMLEVVATAVAAGIVLCSVAVGVIGMALGLSRHDIGDRALTDGYIGGAIGAGLAFVDAILRYFA
jgi:hypothetical protein